MEAVKFTLSGQTAFFKKPDVNEYCYFTYGHIHKVALLGILGAIVGYTGYGTKLQDVKKEKNFSKDYPEFYKKLRQIKIAIVPKNEKGYIPKKIQIFNNSVGYANKDGNLIVKEQWLENPVWDIYILINCDEAEYIASYIEKNRCIYYPYLGKNDHPADIMNVKRLTVSNINEKEIKISSLFLERIGKTIKLGEYDDIDIIRYCERLPIALNPYTNLYEYEDFCYTNARINVINGELYKCQSDVLQFF